MGLMAALSSPNGLGCARLFVCDMRPTLFAGSRTPKVSIAADRPESEGFSCGRRLVSHARQNSYKWPAFTVVLANDNILPTKGRTLGLANYRRSPNKLLCKFLAFLKIAIRLEVCENLLRFVIIANYFGKSEKVNLYELLA